MQNNIKFKKMVEISEIILYIYIYILSLFFFNNEIYLYIFLLSIIYYKKSQVLLLPLYDVFNKVKIRKRHSYQPRNPKRYASFDQKNNFNEKDINKLEKNINYEKTKEIYNNNKVTKGDIDRMTKHPTLVKVIYDKKSVSISVINYTHTDSKELGSKFIGYDKNGKRSYLAEKKSNSI